MSDFKPSEEFLEFMCELIGNRLLIHVECEDGRFVTAMNERKKKVIGTNSSAEFESSSAKCLTPIYPGPADDCAALPFENIFVLFVSPFDSKLFESVHSKMHETSKIFLLAKDGQPFPKDTVFSGTDCPTVDGFEFLKIQ